MKLVDAVRLSDGEHCEVWIDRERFPLIGARFTEEGVKYRRLPNGAQPTHGSGLDFSKGPITMWTEPPLGRAPFRADHYTPDGMSPVFHNMRELRNYEARSKGTQFERVWTK